MTEITLPEGRNHMIRSSQRFIPAALVAACVLAAGPSFAQATAAPATKAPQANAPVLLGTFKNWTAYSTTAAGNVKVCYVLSQPKSSEPKNATRDPMFFLIGDWPSRKVKGEVEVVAGYPYKDGSKVGTQVGSDKFTFFTQNDGSDGTAWVEDLSQEPNLVDAMRRGSQMTVTGMSARGTLTKDTYSLSGVSAALDKIHAACGM